MTIPADNIASSSYYAIANLGVQGQCSCYGHSAVCTGQVSKYEILLLLLAPSEGWGKVIVSICLSVHTRVHWSMSFLRDIPVTGPRSLPREYPSMGYPQPVMGYPLARDGVPPGKGQQREYLLHGGPLVFTQEDFLVIIYFQ